MKQSKYILIKMMILFQFDWNQKELDFHSQSLFDILKHALDRQKHNQTFHYQFFRSSSKPTLKFIS